MSNVTVVRINTSPDMHPDPDPVCEILYTHPDPVCEILNTDPDSHSRSVRGCSLVRRTSSRITFTHGRVRLHISSSDISATPRRPVRKRRDPRLRQQMKVIRYLPPSQLATPPQVGSTVDASTSTAEDGLIAPVCDGAGSSAVVEDDATRLLPPTFDSGSPIPASAPPPSEYRLSLSELYQNGLFESPSDVIKESRGGCQLTALSRPSRPGVDSPDSGLEASEEELVASPQPTSCSVLQCAEAVGLQEVREQLDRDQEFIIVVSETVPLRRDAEGRLIGRLTEFFDTKDTVFSDSEDSVFSWGTSIVSSRVPTSSSDSQEESAFPWDCQTTTKDLLCPLTRENVHLLNAQSEKVRLQLPRSLLALHALLLLDTDMRSATGPAADLYTVLGGTVRGYPASWHRLGTRYDEESTSSDLQPTSAESLLSSGAGSTSSQELPQQNTSNSSTSSIEDWTLGRRRGQTSRLQPQNGTGLSSQLVLNQRRHLKNDLVEDSEEDDWYPVCASCKETVYPQDSARLCPSTVYHRVCLRCCKCDLTLGHAEVKVNGRLIYCLKHAPNGSSLANLHLDTDRLQPFSRQQLPEFHGMCSKT